MNKYWKMACKIARVEINDPKSMHKGQTFREIRNNTYNINMKSKSNIQDALSFKNWIKNDYYKMKEGGENENQMLSKT